MPTSTIVKKLLGDREIIKKKFTISLKYLRLKLAISLLKWALAFSLLTLLLVFFQSSLGGIFPWLESSSGYDSFNANSFNDLNAGYSWSLDLTTETGFGWSWLIMAGIFLFIVAPLSFFFHLYYLPISNEFVFTNQRILIKKGWIATNAVSIHYHRITDVSISQSVLDRILRIGSLAISTAGSEGDRISLFHVSRPHTLKKELYDLKDAYFSRQVTINPDLSGAANEE